MLDVGNGALVHEIWNLGGWKRSNLGDTLLQRSIVKEGGRIRLQDLACIESAGNLE